MIKTTLVVLHEGNPSIRRIVLPVAVGAEGPTQATRRQKAISAELGVSRAKLSGTSKKKSAIGAYPVESYRMWQVFSHALVHQRELSAKGRCSTIRGI